MGVVVEVMSQTRGVGWGGKEGGFVGGVGVVIVPLVFEGGENCGRGGGCASWLI